MQNYHTSIVEGAKCKINLTIMFSSSSYPKNIYNMPLVEKGVEIQFEFEFKFKFELNQKRNGKRKRRKKRKERAQTLMGWLRAKRPGSLSPAQVSRAQATATNKRKKRKRPSPPGQGTWPPLLLGPGGRSSSSEL